MRLVLDFDEIGAGDLPSVGGKGANLGEMTKAGFPVPPGFCVTTAAFDLFMDGMEDIYDELEQVRIDDLDAIREIGENVRGRIVGQAVPSDIREAVLSAWRETGEEHAYAVRSSATAEDLPDASFAGQQDTYLNVVGEEALMDSVRRCWTSLFTDRAILYRVKNGFPHRDVKLSVVVQRMVMSEKSGTLFTADPLTGHRYTLTIDASFGLGEALVSGLVTPDNYHVDKRSMRISDITVSEKKLAIYPVKEGGTEKVEIGEERMHQRVLTDAEVTELAEMAVEVERHYGIPQDMEWAFESGELYLLQTRPITSLYPIEGLEYPEGQLGIFFSSGHQQGMTNAMTTLSRSALSMMAPIGQVEGEYRTRYMRSAGSRLFMDITLLLRHRILRKGVMRGISQFDMLAPEALRQLMKRPEFKRSPSAHIPLSFVPKFMGFGRRLYLGIWKKNHSGFLERTNALIRKRVFSFEDRLQQTPVGKERLEVITREMQGFFSFIFEFWIPEAAAGIAATKMLEEDTEKWLGEEASHEISLGIPGNVVNEMNLMLGDIAEYVKAHPDLKDAFESMGDDVAGWFEKVEGLEGSSGFMKMWSRFMDTYGMRGASEIDMASPRWYEDPLPVLKVIADNVNREESYRQRFEKQAARREEVFEQLLKTAGRGFLGRREKRLRRLYSTMVEIGGMREHHKFAAVKYMAVIKESLKAVAEELVRRDLIQSSDDIWFLEWGELIRIWEDSGTDWKKLVEERRQEHIRDQRLSPPIIITSDGETPFVDYTVKDAPEGALLGNPVSSGVVEGTVHVIHDPVAENLSPGEILVTKFTDPGWTPLFINAGAVVLEVGGALTHGAVVAREYGIPAVVGVRNATSELRTGQRIRVDGNRGIVEVLEEETPESGHPRP